MTIHIILSEKERVFLRQAIAHAVPAAVFDGEQRLVLREIGERLDVLAATDPRPEPVEEADALSITLGLDVLDQGLACYLGPNNSGAIIDRAAWNAQSRPTRVTITVPRGSE